MGAYLDRRYQIDGVNIILISPEDFKELRETCYYTRFQIGEGYYYPTEARRVRPESHDWVGCSSIFVWEDI